MRILALGGSIRGIASLNKESILNTVHKSSSKEALIDRLRSGTANYSNTEILCAVSLLGAAAQGAEIDYYPLSRLFPRKETNPNIPIASPHTEPEYFNLDNLKLNAKELLILESKIQSASGIILSSPVYFGDRSSVSNKVLQLGLQKNYFSQKVIAAISAGAKRNGGQETTNIYLLQEAKLQGAYVVGNGPPTSQYGGTAVGGDIGSVLSDDWGLSTCEGTGKRVAQVSRLLNLKTSNQQNNKITIGFFITMDHNSRQLLKRALQLKTWVEQKYPHINLKIFNLLDHEFERCLACPICPIPELRNQESDYACIIQTKRDWMQEARENLRSIDALILAGVNLVDMKQVTFRYQAFTERTRFIRRNDFELTNLPITSYTLEEVGAQNNGLFDLKVMTSYLRHNGILCPPIKDWYHQQSLIQNASNQWHDFIYRAQLIAQARRNHKGVKTQYIASGEGGYQDDRLDSTSSVRN